ncbi:MAG TPA: Clp protease N-terminal domain-containing protein, partial [Silvibacterium sp.]|nr:Clp protease N-terminal domain-containing protein [Silvibacterium sp.]
MAIRWDKFTVKSLDAIQTAGTLAAENGNPEASPLHILAVLLEDKDGIIVPLLQKVG